MDVKKIIDLSGGIYKLSKLMGLSYPTVKKRYTEGSFTLKESKKITEIFENKIEEMKKCNAEIKGSFEW